MRRAVAIAAAMALCALTSAAEAHVGSPDAVQDGQAGPYHLLVTIRPPEVIPGIAQVEIRALDDDVARVSVVPLPLRGPGVSSPPVADVARPRPDDPRDFDSAIWLMQTGAWQIRVTAEGARGAGVMAVPIPALARTVRPMPGFLALLLFALMALLVAGAIAIMGAGLRESDLAPGAAPDDHRIARGRTAMAVTAVILALAIVGGRRWWNGEAGSYRRLIYKPMQVSVAQPSSGGLDLTLSDPGWLRWRHTDDLIPDHGHLMHLFLVRSPGLDAIAHLHPRRTGEATFAQATPPLPAGSYRLFGDIVHQTGLDETVTADAGADRCAGRALRSPGRERDPTTRARSFRARRPSTCRRSSSPTAAAGCGGSTRAPPGPARQSRSRSRSRGPTARPAAAIQPYMGMAGHAMIVARDFTVFAHVHPTGSVPMAAMALVEGAGVVDHAHHLGMTFAPRVQFPVVFPRAGDYRLFVQIKRDERIETAAFDLSVR